MIFGSIFNYGQIHWDLFVAEDHKKGYRSSAWTRAR
jgi:hypothetical protein